jgi:hypothetical protein
MRRLILLGFSSFSSFSSLTALLGLGGCGGVDTGGTGGAAPSPDVTGDIADIYLPTTGQTTHVDLQTWTSIAARPVVSGVYTTFAGSIDPTGKLTIPGVPQGPYLLELTSPAPAAYPDAKPYKSYFETSARELDLGVTYSSRQDVVAMTKPTFLLIDTTLTIPWHAFTADAMGNTTQPLDDGIQIISRNAGVTGTYVSQQSPTDEGPPADGATKLAWKIDATSAFSFSGNLTLIDGSHGDDLTILHDVRHQVGVSDNVDPWKGYTYQSTEEVFHALVPTMTDGGLSALHGQFQAVKQSSFAFDYKGSAFNALLGGAPIDYAFVDFSIYLEPGKPRPLIGAFATLFDASALSVPVYTNPSCAGAACDPAACAGGCDLGTFTLPGDHSHTFSYGNPFDFGQELGSLYVTLRTNVQNLLPEKTPERLRALFTFQGPIAEFNGKPIQPALGLPQNIRVGGKTTPYTQVTAGVGVEPAITWSPPALGTPSSYRVTVVDLTDILDKDGNPLYRRNIALFDVTTTSVKLPPGLLESGKFYYFQVAARIRDNVDRAAPYRNLPSREAISQMFTGVVTP